MDGSIGINKNVINFVSVCLLSHITSGWYLFYICSSVERAPSYKITNSTRLLEINRDANSLLLIIVVSHAENKIHYPTSKRLLNNREAQNSFSWAGLLSKLFIRISFLNCDSEEDSLDLLANNLNSQRMQHPENEFQNQNDLVQPLKLISKIVIEFGLDTNQKKISAFSI